MSELKGCITPVVTPFRNGEIDFPALEGLIDWQITSGAHGISVTGTTGEPGSLSISERREVMRVAKDAVGGRVPFVPGTGSVHHEETLSLTRYAEEIGSDAAMVISPYYVRPSQEGLFLHFDAVIASTDLPIILYNIPGRTAINIEIGTVARLKERHPNLIGVKESNKDFEHINRLLYTMGSDFNVYSGIELLCFPILAIGGAGYISATANVLPEKVARLYDLTVAGDWEAARRLHFELLPLNDAIFLEINPVPVKALLGMMGKIDGNPRLPLAPVSEENRATLLRLAAQYGLADLRADSGSQS